MALKADGTVVAWGNNFRNQTTIPAGLTNVVAIAGGGSHTVALKADGTVVAWGDSSYNKTTIPAGLTNVVAIAAGGDHTVALKADGTVVAWGDNTYGQRTIPAGRTTAVGVAAGGAHTVVIRLNGTLGQTITFGTLTAKTSGDVFVVSATASSGLSPTFSIVSGPATISGNTITLTGVGTVVVRASQAGDSDYSAATPIDQSLTSLQPPIVTTAPVARTVVNAGSGFTLTVAATGAAPLSYQWYQNNRVIAGATGASYTDLSAGDQDQGAYTVKITDGNNATARATGFVKVQLPGPSSVVAWGYNSFGQTTIPAGLTTVVAVAAGNSHTVALKADGTVVAWGSNGYGQTTIPAGLTTLVAVAAGYYHTVALKADGTVVAWGSNTSGQTAIPDGLTNVVSVAGGGSHTVALKSDGTVVAWGSNTSGQTTIPAGLTTVVAVGAGASHTVALKADGTVVAWGNNSSGQRTIPAGLTNVVAVAGGFSFSVALKADGTVVAWGDNSYGQRTIPAGLTNVIAVAAGSPHTVALRLNAAQAQTITFGALSAKTYGDAPFVVSATASSGLSPTFSILSGPATISGSTVTLTGAGTVVVRAAQPGNASYLAATPVDRSFTVNTALQSWRQLYFGTAANTGVAADSAISNLDGLPNLVEYALGGNPTIANSTIPPQLGTVTNGGGTFLTLTFKPQRSDITYAIEVSGSLTGSWTTIPLAGLLTMGQTYTYTDTVPVAAGAPRFIRLRVSGQ